MHRMDRFRQKRTLPSIPSSYAWYRERVGEIFGVCNFYRVPVPDNCEATGWRTSCHVIAESDLRSGFGPGIMGFGISSPWGILPP